MCAHACIRKQTAKMNKNRHIHLLISFVVLILFFVAPAHGEQQPYLCDIGVQGGMGYYIGDGQKHPFMHPREVYGGQFRYKFNNRWAVQLKGQYQRIALKVDGATPVSEPILWTNNMINIDAVGEFNFFRYGEKTNDTRIKPITPYIFLGFGMALYDEMDDPYSNFALYIPLGIGMKWRFAPRWQMLVAWQHNIYFWDDVENREELGNTYDMNGSNFMNNDITGQLTLGIVFEFAQQKGDCKHCSWK